MLATIVCCCGNKLAIPLEHPKDAFPCSCGNAALRSSSPSELGNLPSFTAENEAYSACSVSDAFDLQCNSRALEQWHVLLTAHLVEHPKCANGYARRGAIRLQTGNYQEAIQDISRAIDGGLADPLLWRLRGKALHALEMQDEARANLDQAISLAPDDLLNYAARAELLLAIGDYQGAIDDANQVLLKKTSPSVILIRAQARMKQGEISGSVDDFHAVLTADNQNAAAHFGLGLIHLNQGKMEVANAALSKAISLSPDWAAPYESRGHCHRARSNKAAAIADYSDALRLAPMLSDSLINRGLTFAELKEFDRAINDFTSALRLQPNDARIHTLRANCWIGKGNGRVGIDDFTRAIELDPNVASVYVSRGYSYLRERNYALAKADFSSAITLSPTLAAAYFGRSLASLHLGEDSLANSDHQQAIACEPRDANQYQLCRLLSEAMLRLNQEQYDQAIELSTQAIQVAAAPASSYGIRAIVYWFSGQLVEAVEDFSRMLELEPYSHRAYSGRGQVYGELGEFELAIADLNKAIKLAPTKDPNDNVFAYCHSGRGLAMAGLNRFEEAHADFACSVQKCPANAWVYYNLGVVYDKQCQAANACVCFRLSLRLHDPELPIVKRRRAQGYLAENASPKHLNG